MTWEFLLVVLAVVLVPGVDLLMVLRNTVSGGRRVGVATTAGVSAASAIQGTLVAGGVGILIVQSQWMFQAIKWAGIAYLVLLGVQSLKSALGGPETGVHCPDAFTVRWTRGFRQGFLCNITNPKMFVFYLSLLPQFVNGEAPVWAWLLHAWALPVIGSAWLVIVAVLADVVRERLMRPLVRRVTDVVVGVALLGFGARLATER